jgi:2,3-bisphosphoglycerate-independent phosphoglycerate mutase
MKYAIVIPDGCADLPQASLAGRTPLEAANIPFMDSVAAAGVVGRACHVPREFTPGSDVANLSLFGFDPRRYFTGRAPLEAAAQGIELGPGDWAVRCNLVTIENQVMRDFTAGHITSTEARELLASAQEQLDSAEWQYVAGVSYRNLLIYRPRPGKAIFSEDTRATAPHDLTDQSVLDDYPRGPGSDVLNRLMSDSVALFATHPVNAARRERGEPPATNLWLWGLGRRPALPSFRELHGIQGAMITAVDLLRGLAALVGWKRLEVAGATGYLDTDYAAKGRRAVEELAGHDLVCVHVEATDEASHEGRCDAKIEALEQIDRHIVGPLLEALRRQGAFRLMVTPDHPTPVSTKMHSHGAVPFAVCGTGVSPDASRTYDEPTARASSLAFDEGWRLMEWFLRGNA